MEITKEDEKEIKELAMDPNIYKLITNSIIPSLHGLNDIKQAIALQLFGGVSKVDQLNISGEINILIVSDPGMGISTLLRGTSRLASEGFYVDCTKYKDFFSDSEFRDKILEEKTSQSHMICIDDLEIKKDEVGVLKEMLGKKSSFANKKDVLNVLKSDNPVLMASRPGFDRFDRFKSLSVQLKLPATILSSLDLLFILSDEINLVKDQKLALHLLNYQLGNRISSPIQPELLKKYIAYARQNVHPKLSLPAANMFQEFYIRVRSSLLDEYEPVPITPCYLESLVRLSEASARIRLSDTVTTSDAKRVISISTYCLRNAGYAPDQSVIINIDKINEDSSFLKPDKYNQITFDEYKD